MANGHDIQRARTALHAIPLSCDRAEWLKTGRAAKAAGLDFEDFDRWSRSTSIYQGEQECRSVWDSFEEKGGFDPDTVFKLGPDAKQQVLKRAELPAVWPSTSGSVARYFDTPPPPLHWFVHERLLSNRAHLLTGVGGTSKTTVLYHLGIGAVLGRLPWRWDVKRTGSAILILAEDDASNVHRVIANHAAHGNLSQADHLLIAERLHVFPLAGQWCRLLAAGPNGTLVETEMARGLFQLVKQTPDLVFIGLDPALALTDGDEMSPAHQRRLGEFADRLALQAGACVVLASHSAKATTTADEVGSHNSRGSGAITDAVRGEFALRTMTAAEARRFGITDLAERKAHVQLVMTKSNAAPPSAFVPEWLKRGIGGLLSPAQIEEGEAETIGPRERKALDILINLTRDSTPQMKDWRERCIAEGIVTGKNDAAREKCMNRIRTALLKGNLIERGSTKGIYAPVKEMEES